MNLPINIQKKDKILIVAPHPDDECIGLGGMLSLFSKQCDIVVLTDGRYGTKKNSPEIEIAVRRSQFENEMQYLKITTYQFLGYEDGTLMQHNECMSQIDFSKYTKVFIPALDDNHVDHTAASMFAIEKIKWQNLKDIEVYQYEVHTPLHDISHYLDITEVIEEKSKLIKFHEDQLQYLDYDNIANSLAKYRACQANKGDRYFETYLKINIFTDKVEIKNFEREKRIQKYQLFHRTLIQWVQNKQKGVVMSKYLTQKGINKIAIYGFSDLGKLLYDELKKTEIVIEYVMDKRTISDKVDGVRIFIPQEGNRVIDAIIVSAIYYFDEIKHELNELGYKNIISLQELVEEMDNGV